MRSSALFIFEFLGWAYVSLFYKSAEKRQSIKEEHHGYANVGKLVAFGLGGLCACIVLILKLFLSK